MPDCGNSHAWKNFVISVGENWILLHPDCRGQKGAKHTYIHLYHINIWIISFSVFLFRDDTPACGYARPYAALGHHPDQHPGLSRKVAIFIEFTSNLHHNREQTPSELRAIFIELIPTGSNVQELVSNA